MLLAASYSREKLHALLAGQSMSVLRMWQNLSIAGVDHTLQGHNGAEYNIIEHQYEPQARDFRSWPTIPVAAGWTMASCACHNLRQLQGSSCRIRQLFKRKNIQAAPHN